MSTPSSTVVPQPTYAIELTPPGRAAVAVVLVAGPLAVAAVTSCFKSSSGHPLSNIALSRIAFGRWGSETGEELIVCRRKEDQLEIHCHGGATAVKRVVADLQGQGCEPLRCDDWLRHSIADPIRAEAQVALSRAMTTRTAAILLDQLNGALSATIAELIRELAAANWPTAAERILNILQHRDLGMHLVSPWRVVFAGPPNVGKSSLINALAGYQRAIVSPIPGTTRDVVTLTTAIDGWPVELADTAGLRSTDDELEAAGVELAQSALATADLAVLVQDATNPAASPRFDPRAVPPRVIHVLNKIDLVSAGDLPAFDSTSLPTQLATSAETGAGIADLAAAIGRSLVPNPPACGDAVPFTAQQVELLTVASNAIQRQHAAAAIEALQSLLPKKGPSPG